jgi:hypothetical protein
MLPIGTSHTNPCYTFASSSTYSDPIFESQSFFIKDLWKKFSPFTQRCLFENQFTFPPDLKKNFRYHETHDGIFIIDLETSIGHAKLGEIRFGQNLTTKEFLAFKLIDYDASHIDENHQNHQEVVALRNLKRFKGLIFDKSERAVYVAMELINGVTVADYNWEEHSGSLSHALKLAISYLEELEFVAKSKVNQSDQNPRNIMIDLKKDKVFLIDFTGHATFNYKTASFYPDPFFPSINLMDLDTVIALLPNPFILQKNHILAEKYGSFYCWLKQIRKSDETRNEENFYYLKMSITKLKTDLSLLLQTL